MYICLMRHGKSEPYQKGIPDERRELIAVGKEQVKQMIETATRWWPDGKTCLWSSPYIRACQTASYFANHIAYDSFHRHQAIAEGDLIAVYHDIICPSDADVVCLIGHSPYLEQWAYQWSGIRLDFTTGSMALFDYDKYSGALGTGSLMLYIQPKVVSLLHQPRE